MRARLCTVRQSDHDPSAPRRPPPHRPAPHAAKVPRRPARTTPLPPRAKHAAPPRPLTALPDCGAHGRERSRHRIPAQRRPTWRSRSTPGDRRDGARPARSARRGGGLFILGVGGGAGHASHAVNDFRKLCWLESYAPSDNVSELTARTNDDGWETSYAAWLDVSRLRAATRCSCSRSAAGRASTTCRSTWSTRIERAQRVGAAIFGVVGAPGGTLAELADVAVLIEPPPDLRTPLVESFQAVVWHALVSHPELAARQGHWETLATRAGRDAGRAAACFARPRRRAQRAGARSRHGRPESPLRVAATYAWSPGAAAAARALRQAGYELVCVTNQPAAAKGRCPSPTLEVQRRVLDLLAAEGVTLDAWRMCLHHPGGSRRCLRRRCDCRKPAPGMLLDAAGELELDLTRSWMVGDTDADMQAGRAAGCPTMPSTGRAARTSASGRERGGWLTADPDEPRATPAASTPVNRVRCSIGFPPASSPTAPTSTASWRWPPTPASPGFTTNPTLMWKAGPDRLRGVRPAPAGADHAPSDLLRGVRRRHRGDAPPG